MKKYAFRIGIPLVLILLFLTVLYASQRTDLPSLAEQIEADQDLPAGSVTLLSEGGVTQGQEQAVGFFDHQGSPGLALTSRQDPPQLLQVEPAGSFSSRAPSVWITYVSVGGEDYGVLLSRNPDFACLRVCQAEGVWEDLPVPPPPSMVCFALADHGATEYRLCNAAGEEL